VRRGKSRPAFPSLGGSGVYAIRALPDLCLQVVLQRLEKHLAGLSFAMCIGGNVTKR